jgi:UDP-N-acetylmuramoylalanine--D-glutamate ligase
MKADWKLIDFKKNMSGTKIAVLGVGISNRPLIRYIHSLGALITAFDSLELSDPVLSNTIKEFEKEGISIEWSCGKDYLSGLPDGNFTYIFRTPKLRPDVPEILSAVRKGSILTSEMEVFLALCPARIFAVTGSDGKTTTTTLIYEILKQAGYTVHVGGNIGTPLLDRIDSISESDMVVLELSSFQLISMRSRIDVAVVTNVTPNHLDVHLDYKEYINSKKNIFLSQTYSGRLVLNADNEITRAMASEARGKVICFSSEEHAPLDQHSLSLIDQAFIKNGVLCYLKNGHLTEIVKSDDILIPGFHNIMNYLAAISAIMPFADPEHIAEVARNFGGVEHRIELVRTLNGVRYFNSSIDTSPTRTINAMNALRDRKERGVLIAGGADKKCSYAGLGKAILEVCDRVILYGQNSELIEKVLADECKDTKYTVFHSNGYDEAVSLAKSLAQSGEIVILSPAGTSYDHFRHFEERGKLFKKLVSELE